MRNQVNKVAISPLSSVYSAVTDTLVHVPFHGGGAGAINLAAASAIVQGYPTKIVLASTPSPLPMPGTYVKLNSVTPTTYNGYHKVIAASGANVWLDLDSSALAAWSSGGNMSFNVIYDRLGNLAQQDVSGTITGIWANQAHGLTSHSAGNYTARITEANASAFSLDGFAGFLVIGCKVIVPANPSADEYIFSMGRTSATGGYTGSGGLSLRLTTATTPQMILTFRPRTVVGDDAGGAAGGSNTLVYSTDLGNAAVRNVVYLLDLRSTSSATCYCYLDGVQKAAAALTLTNMIDWPGITNGIVFGANLNGSLVPAEYLGAAAVTPSQARVSDFLFWETTKGLTTVQRAINRWSTLGELPREVV